MVEAQTGGGGSINKTVRKARPDPLARKAWKEIFGEGTVEKEE
jgi:hypothetical protein